MAKYFCGFSSIEYLMSQCTARYKLNDNAANSTVVDTTGNYNGTYKNGDGEINTSTGSASGKINEALDFDGTEWVEVADNDVFTPTARAFSISCWAKIGTITGFTFVSKIAEGVNHEWRFGLAKVIDKLIFDICDTDNGDPYVKIRGQYSGALTPYIDIWTHFAATYDGGVSGDNIHLYINGEQVDDVHETEDGFVSCKNSDQVVRIGRREEYLSIGQLDAVLIFDSKELTADEVKLLYNNNKGYE